MSAREIEYRQQIEKLTQPDLVTVLCATIATIDDEHLEEAIEQIADEHLGTLVAKGILEQRKRETEQDNLRMIEQGR